jgi:hypothetical protein
MVMLSLMLVGVIRPLPTYGDTLQTSKQEQHSDEVLLHKAIDGLLDRYKLNLRVVQQHRYQSKLQFGVGFYYLSVCQRPASLILVVVC